MLLLVEGADELPDPWVEVDAPSEVLADPAMFTLEGGRITPHLRAHADRIIAERAQPSLFERAVKAEVDRRVAEFDARLAALEKKPLR